MKEKKVFLLILSLLITASMLLASCSPAAAPVVDEPAAEAPAAEEAATEAPVVEEAAPVEPVVLTYWHTMSDPETAQLDLVIADFEAANPGITVEATRYSWDDFKPALLTALAGNAAPDTARMDIAWVPEFAEQGALMQLDGAMPEFEAIAADAFPGPLSTNFWQGHYYGLPQNTNTQVLLWNREALAAGGFTEAPKTMEEFQTVACAISDKANEKYGYALGGTYFWAPAPIFYAMGGKVVNEGITTATGYVNSAESVAAFTMLTEMYNDGCISPNLLGGGVGTSDGLATGMYGMIIDGPWMVDIYKDQYPNFEVNFAPIPTANGNTSSVVGGEDVVVFYDTDAAEAAMKWTAYLMSPASQLKMAEVGVIPTLSSLMGNENLPAYFGVFLDQLQTAQARVPHPVWSDMDSAINNAFQRMLNGDQDPQAALDQAAEEINALLQ